ncbi:MAG: Gfo/Idh/MocA family oxidoreductase [candidate division WOR-3 bacterium]|nr:Gfo/Idh/MocA family oxidoreductase [candidate division WOR-3 bacterium]
MSRIKIALVGCGRISERHFEVIEELSEDLELIAVCDIDEGKALHAGKHNNAAVYTDYSKMLDETFPDIISICTPSGLHARQGISASKKGIDVIVEKPMAISLKDADDLIESCDSNNVKLYVIKQNRLNSSVQMLKKAVDKNRFGQLYFVNTTVFWQRPQSYYDLADWRGTWEFDGGSFMNQASHYIDLISWLSGPVDYVMSITGTLARDIEAEDTGAAVLKFRNGAIGVIQVTMLTYPKNLEGSITMIGEKGTAKIGGTAVNKIEEWEFEEYDDDDKLIQQANYNPPNVYGYGHLGYYRQVIKDLKQQSNTSIDGRAGRKSLELILAIYKSAKTGKRISLPLNYPV